MSVASSEKINKKNIKFAKKNLLDKDAIKSKNKHIKNYWTVDTDDGIGAGMTVGSKDTLLYKIVRVAKAPKFQMQYMKIKFSISNSTKVLTTFGTKKVRIRVYIKYTKYNDDNNSEEDDCTTIDFFPCYDYEDKYKDNKNAGNYVIVTVPKGAVKSIEVQIYNGETQSIVIKKLGLYYAHYVDKDNMSDILNDGYTDGSNELVVPEVKSIDDMKNKRWHSIAILSKNK